MATRKQILKLGMPVLNAYKVSGSLSFFRSPWNSSQNSFHYRHISQLPNNPNGKHVYLPDKLAMVKYLEAKDVPSKQAEAISFVICDILGIVSCSFVTKEEMQDNEVIQESILYRIERIQKSIKSDQEYQFSLLEREIEKLQNEVEVMRIELRHEIHKLRAHHVLDLNHERSYTRDNHAETIDLLNKLILEMELSSLKAQHEREAAKYVVIKFVFGGIVVGFWLSTIVLYH